MCFFACISILTVSVFALYPVFLKKRPAITATVFAAIIALLFWPLKHNAANDLIAMLSPLLFFLYSLSGSRKINGSNDPALTDAE